MVADVHDLDRYRAGCRCDVCKAANRDYMREYRKQRRGFSDASLDTNASVTVLPAPPVVEGVPGPVEQAIIDRCTSGDLVSSAQRMPELVASCRALARVLDDPKQVTTMPSAHRQLMAGMTKLEAASVFGKKNRLSSVAALAQRRPASGVG